MRSDVLCCPRSSSLIRITGAIGGSERFSSDKATTTGLLTMARVRKKRSSAFLWIPQTLADKLDAEGKRRKDRLAEWQKRGRR